MQASELRNKSEQELKKLLNKLDKEMEELTTSVLKGKEKNVRKKRFLKLDYARVKTVLNEKKILKEMEARE